MKILPLQHGTPEWLEARKGFDCASDAAMVMDQDKQRTRNDGVRTFAIGDAKEFSAWVQSSLLDRGHEVEDKARDLLAAEIGEPIFPCVIVNDDGTKLASLDGATVMFDHVIEHKLANKELVAYIVEHNDLPPSHWPQCEHIIHASDDDIEAVTFVVSDGTVNGRFMFDYQSKPKRRKQLLAAWKQFREDVKNYKHVEIAPKPVGTALAPLPPLAVSVMGAVERSNFPEFKGAALAMIQAIPTTLKTDQDFANAESAIKWLDDGEKQCESVKKLVLAGAASINEVMLGLDEIRETMRSKRLPLKSLVETRKSAIRAEIVQEGRDAIREHQKAQNKRVGGYLPLDAEALEEHIADRMSGKRTVATLRNAMDAEVARVKIATNELADSIQANLEEYATTGADQFGFLFNDLASLVIKPPEDFKTLVAARIVEHKRKELDRIEQERERIRQEERERAEREARERQEREKQEERDRMAKAERELQEQMRLEREQKAQEQARTHPQEPARQPDVIDAEIVQTTPRTEPTAPITRPTMSSRERMLREKPDDERFEEWIIACVANQYDVNVQQAASWVVTMNLDNIRERHALEGLL